jgi:hypothetical protein
MASGGALVLIERAARLLGLDLRALAMGQSGMAIFVFFVVAPLQEAAKVAAVWPALKLKRFDQPFDGVAHAASSALGFAAIESSLVLRAYPSSGVWIARELLALPAHVFCSCLWGYALGLAKRRRPRAVSFPGAFTVSVMAHGFYAYFLYSRGPGALYALTPLLSAMGLLTWLLARDLTGLPTQLESMPPSFRPRRLSQWSQPPSLSAVRTALRAEDEPVRLGWIVFGALVTFGSMIAGLAAGVFAAHALHLDLASIDEHAIGTATPALLVVFGLLASFPASGWLVARAAGVHTLLEPALATVLALLMTVVVLGFAAPFTVVFALAISPVAWLLSCIGAWAGRIT